MPYVIRKAPALSSKKIPAVYSSEVDLEADYSTGKPSGRKSQINSPQAINDALASEVKDEDSGDDGRSKYTND